MYKLKILDTNKLFFTSDLHFNHFNIANYCNRPYTSRKDMNDSLIANWNSVVPEDGIVINCGDFLLCHKENTKEYANFANKLNGKQLLIRGNHDRVPLVINPEPELKKFIAIVDIAIIEFDNFNMIASHYPLMAFSAEYNVFGHVHTLKDGLIANLDSYMNNIILRDRQYDVGVDQNNYKPISYKELMLKFQG